MHVSVCIVEGRTTLDNNNKEVSRGAPEFNNIRFIPIIIKHNVVLVHNLEKQKNKLLSRSNGSKSEVHATGHIPGLANHPCTHRDATPTLPWQPKCQEEGEGGKEEEERTKALKSHRQLSYCPLRTLSTQLAVKETSLATESPVVTRSDS